MKRRIMQALLRWKDKSNRQPLILNGARQVGKTYILKKFAQEQFSNVAYFNLEHNLMARELFEGSLDALPLIHNLEVVSHEPISANSTLIILDEIQSCPRALTALKEFSENASQYHIVAAGSLLGVAINREHYSFPVGKVDELTLYPMDFEEFLWAMNETQLSDLIRVHYTSCEPMLNALHERALELYRQYLIVGGMPAAVAQFSTTGSYLDVADVQQRVLNDYTADMAKYADASSAVKIRACYNSIPAQLAKENHKFQYKVVQRGGSATIFGESIEWLNYAGVVLKCDKITEGSIPVAAYVDLSDFKLYMSDVGLLTLRSGMPTSMILSPLHEENTFLGAIAENYVAQALVASGFHLYYWKSNNSAEVDFIVQQSSQVIPVEVKSGRNTRSRSLNVYCGRYKSQLAYRFSQKNFGFENGIKSLPLYAVFCIGDR